MTALGGGDRVFERQLRPVGFQKGPAVHSLGLHLLAGLPVVLGGSDPVDWPPNAVLEELSEKDRQTVARARRLERFLSQPFFSTEAFTGKPGRFVSRFTSEPSLLIV